VGSDPILNGRRYLISNGSVSSLLPSHFDHERKREWYNIIIRTIFS
jgi:hypothetical protein